MKDRLTAGEQKIFNERQKLYLDATWGNEQTGLMWTGLLQNHFQVQFPTPIPADVVLTMLAAHKLCRSVLPTEMNNDSFDDAKIYTELAREARKHREGIK